MPRHPHLSPTSGAVSDSVYSHLLERARELGIDACPLHVGDTYREPLLRARAESQLTSEHPRLHNYAPVQGLPELLDAIARRLEVRAGRAIPLSSIQVMSGATAGLNVVCQALIDPGDEVLIPAPFWPLIRGIVAMRGARPVEIPVLDRLDDTSLDIEALFESHVTERTVALYLNSPSNPTGQIFSEAQVDALVRVARRHDLWVITDEAYEDLHFGDAPPGPIWAHPGLKDRAIACHTLSKSYGLAGSRVGYTHGPEEAMMAIRGAQTFLTYCAPRPLQLGAVHALEEGDAWLEECRGLYGMAGREAAGALGVSAPAGGTFLFFDASPYMREDADSSAPFLERCLEAGVLLTPGGSCGADYAKWVRLCFTSVPPDELGRALDQLRPLVGR